MCLHCMFVHGSLTEDKLIQPLHFTDKEAEAQWSDKPVLEGMIASVQKDGPSRIYIRPARRVSYLISPCLVTNAWKIVVSTHHEEVYISSVQIHTCYTES